MTIIETPVNIAETVQNILDAQWQNDLNELSWEDAIECGLYDPPPSSHDNGENTCPQHSKPTTRI